MLLLLIVDSAMTEQQLTFFVIDKESLTSQHCFNAGSVLPKCL